MKQNNPPQIDLHDAQWKLWIEELRGLMLADPVLINFEPMLEDAHLFTISRPVHPIQNRSISAWKDGQRHLAIQHWEDTGKFSIISFQVLDWRRNCFSAFSDEVIIDIDLYAETTRVGSDPYVTHVIDPTQDDPIRYNHLFIFKGRATIDTVDLQLGDLLKRFPSFVEAISNRISFLGEVLLAGMNWA